MSFNPFAKQTKMVKGQFVIIVEFVNTFCSDNYRAIAN